MFRDSSNGIEEYTTSVIGFINKCIDDVVPHSDRTCIPQPKARATASTPEAYKKSRYALRRTIKQAKRQYRTKIESYYTGSDARRMWQSVQTLTDYKGKHSRELPSDTSLPDKLNYLYAHFEANNTETGMHQLYRKTVSSRSLQPM